MRRLTVSRPKKTSFVVIILSVACIIVAGTVLAGALSFRFQSSAELSQLPPITRDELAITQEMAETSMRLVQNYPATVSALLGKVRFALSSTADARLRITSPVGTTYGLNGSTSNFAYLKEGNGEMYEIPNPEPGDWIIAVYSADPSITPDHFSLAVYGYGGLNDTQVTEFRPLNVPPEAKTSGPYLALAQKSCILNAINSYDADGLITAFEWDLDNDGVYERKSGDSRTRIKYPDGGTYRVRLKVTDSSGLEAAVESEVVVFDTEESLTESRLAEYTRCDDSLNDMNNNY